jgi:hypothetical protein
MLVLVAGQVALLSWIFSRSAFQQDDIINLVQAEYDPSSHWAFVTHPQNGHWTPGFRAIVRFVSRVFGADWLVTSALSMAFLVAATFVLAALVRRLSGDHRWWPVCVMVFAWSPLVAASAGWWAAALTYFPSMLLAIITVLAGLWWVERPGPGRLVLASLALFVALLFYEKNVLPAMVIPLLVLALPGAGASFSDRFRRVISCWPLGIGLAVALGAWFLMWSHQLAAFDMDPVPVAADNQMLVRAVARSWIQGVPPPVVGGLARHSILLPSVAPAFTEVMLPVMGLCVLGTAVVWSTRRNRASLWAWCSFAAVMTVSILVVARARVGVNGSLLALEPRYLIELVYLLPVFGAVALRQIGESTQHRPGNGGTVAVTPYVLSYAGVFALLSMWSNFVITTNNPLDVVHEWTTNARSSLDRYGAEVTFAEGAVPPEVLLHLPQWAPYWQHSVVLPMYEPGTSVGGQEPRIALLDAAGRATLFERAEAEQIDVAADRWAPIGGTIAQSDAEVCLTADPSAPAILAAAVELPAGAAAISLATRSMGVFSQVVAIDARGAQIALGDRVWFGAEHRTVFATPETPADVEFVGLSVDAGSTMCIRTMTVESLTPSPA